MDIYGNLIAQNRYHGINFSGSLADSLTARVYNNTFYQNYEPEWDSEIRVHANSADISALEIRNNIIYADSDTRCLIDDEGNITHHSNNVYYRPGGGTLVIADGASYTTSNVGSWEPTALSGDPLLENPSHLPTEFTGAFGVDIKPNSNGLSITADSPARDAGAALGAAYSSSINSATRPQLSGWDIGAYELVPDLSLHGVPGDQAIYLDWIVDVALPAASNWRIAYDGPTGDQSSPITSIPSSTHAYTLTGLTNYQIYTVTLSAMLDTTAFLSDTVKVMPTAIFVYLPVVMKGD
jgi:hypothetical protein